jgi:nitrogenase molybdenum-iron protein alpha/beta subunit
MTHDPGAGLSEALSTIEELIAEGRALEATIIDYAKRVHQIRVAVETPPGCRISRYDDLWEVVDDLVIHLATGIESDSVNGRAVWAPKEAAHA